MTWTGTEAQNFLSVPHVGIGHADGGIDAAQQRDLAVEDLEVVVEPAQLAGSGLDSRRARRAQAAKSTSCLVSSVGMPSVLVGVTGHLGVFQLDQIEVPLSEAACIACSISRVRNSSNGS